MRHKVVRMALVLALFVALLAGAATPGGGDGTTPEGRAVAGQGVGPKLPPQSTPTPNAAALAR